MEINPHCEGNELSSGDLQGLGTLPAWWAGLKQLVEARVPASIKAGEMVTQLQMWLDGFEELRSSG